MLKVKTIEVETTVIELPHDLPDEDRKTALTWYSACLSIGYVVIVLHEREPGWTISGYLLELGWSPTVIVRASESEVRSLVDLCFPEAKAVGEPFKHDPTFRGAYLLRCEDERKESELH